jgi:hypothetical protein
MPAIGSAVACVVCDTAGDAGKRFCRHPGRDGSVLGVRSVRSGYAKDPVAGAETGFSRRSALNDTREVYAQDIRIL